MKLSVETKVATAIAAGFIALTAEVSKPAPQTILNNQ